MADTLAASVAESARTPVTVVTGATEGLGLALAREFARAGREVLLVARSRSRLEAVADDLARETDAAVHAQEADLTTVEGRGSVEAAVRENGLVVEFLVNNAGIGLAGAFADADPRRLNALVALNIGAPTDLARRFLPGMLGRNFGGILNVGSLGGFAPGPWQAAYYASKAYILSLTEALAWEATGTRVRVAVLTPGPVNTGFHARMGAQSARYLRFQGLMNADDVARIGYANFMSGQTVIVPGAFNLLSAVALRLAPHVLTAPALGFLFKPRGRADA